MDGALCRDLSGLTEFRAPFRLLCRQCHVASARAHAIHAQVSSPSEPVPRPPDLSLPPTNIQASAAQGCLNLATLRSRRQPDSHSARHTVNFGPDDNQTAFGFGTQLSSKLGST